MIASLRPPAVDITPPLRWVLGAAFSAAEPGLVTQDDLPKLGPLASRLGLLERIAVRHDGAGLPTETREVFKARVTQATAISLLYESIARDVAMTAVKLEVPVAFLKGLAVFLLETSPPGSRPFGDLDVLVPRTSAENLWKALQAKGYLPVGGESTEQHLPGLRGPRGGLLEIHFVLRGLRTADGTAFDLGGLLDRGGVVPLDGFPGDCFVPTRDLLAAHVLVHGFQQHLLRPTSYPLFRMIADLVDLLPTMEEWALMRARWGQSFSDVVPPEDVDAVELLCCDLADGTIPRSVSASAKWRLLAHLVAGALDDAYAASLAPDYLKSRLGEATRRGELSSYLLRKILPARRGEDSLFAGLAGSLGRIGHGLTRQVRATLARLRIGKRAR